ncbi:hypothetical protein [Bifidobacterium callimiconis]|uniref:Flippase n=1 Tax=Bifidobacterium callimiconis TaxID=2306973 RepID=A0A430FE26_9BIFI|nr:flippase [Bifidobacterium callimiconis]
MNSKRQLVVNMTASLTQFIINIGIGFGLSPFVVGKLGAEAYGYVGLANNVISYASLLTIALDSVAGRFITVAYHQGDKEKADRYFSSTFMADCVIAIVVAIIAIPVTLDLEHLINISPHLVADVKMLFTFLFLQFIITSMCTVFTVATFITNKLYLSSLANMAFSILRVVIMVVCFSTLPALVMYVGLAALVGSLAVVALNIHYTRMLTPELRFVRSAVSWITVREMLSAGIWNVVIKLQQVISFGLKLLVANLMVSPYKMGMMSIAQTIPSMISGLMGTISGLFYPDQTKYFAQGKIDMLVRDMKSGMRMCGFFTVVITVVCCVVGREFFFLWQPGQDSDMLYLIMFISMCGFLVSGAATTLQNIPLIVNKLKLYSIAWLLFSLTSLPLTWVLLKTTPLDIYAVAIVPTALEMLANVTFVPIYAAIILGIAKRTFYSVYVQYVASALLSFAACDGLKLALHIPAGTWVTFFASCALYSIVASVITIVVLLGKRERSALLKIVLRKLHLEGRMGGRHLRRH